MKLFYQLKNRIVKPAFLSSQDKLGKSGWGLTEAARPSGQKFLIGTDQSFNVLSRFQGSQIQNVCSGNVIFCFCFLNPVLAVIWMILLWIDAVIDHMDFFQRYPQIVMNFLAAEFRDGQNYICALAINFQIFTKPLSGTFCNCFWICKKCYIMNDRDAFSGNTKRDGVIKKLSNSIILSENPAIGNRQQAFQVIINPCRHPPALMDLTALFPIYLKNRFCPFPVLHQKAI